MYWIFYIVIISKGIAMGTTIQNSSYNLPETVNLEVEDIQGTTMGEINIVPLSKRQDKGVEIIICKFSFSINAKEYIISSLIDGFQILDRNGNKLCFIDPRYTYKKDMRYKDNMLTFTANVDPACFSSPYKAVIVINDINVPLSVLR